MNQMQDERLHFMERTAVGAGEIIMSYWRSDVRVHYKDDKSVVTEADLRSNEHIIGKLTREFPDYGILSEESEDDLARLNKSCIYVIDPLDGSGDFKRMEHDFCVLIGLIENGKPVAGVVYEPKKRRLFSAQQEGQTHMAEGVSLIDGKLYSESEGILLPLTPTGTVNWKNAIVGHPKNYKGDKYNQLYKLLDIPQTRLKGSGSMGTRMMQVALGQTHMILGYTRNLKEWDIAAGHMILEARGVSVTDIEGNPLEYNKETPKTHNGILVAHPSIREDAVNHLRECLSRLPL